MSAASWPEPTPLTTPLQREQRRREQLDERAQWERRLFGNPHLTPHERLTLWAVREEFERGHPYRPENPYGLCEPVHLYRKALAEHIGASEASIGDHVAQLAACGALTTRVARRVDEHGGISSALYIGMTGTALERPDELAPPTTGRDGWGGKRPGSGRPRKTCPACGSEKLLRRTVVEVVCEDCGEIEREEGPAHPVNPPDDPPPINQDDFQAPDSAPPMVHLDSVLDISEERGEGEAGEAEPDQLDEPPRNQDDSLALLVALAGDEHTHVRMKHDRPTAPKYVSDDGPVTLTLARAHAEGRLTLGARLRYQDGTCRALAFDADNDVDAALLCDAARVALQHGYVPLWEWSRTAGHGGHLWLIFDAPVDWRAAYAHVCHVAPMLATIKEHWPQAGDQHVRLPCGLYHHRDGRSDWCVLERAEDGMVVPLSRLAEQLTPAAVVPPLPPEPDPPEPEPHPAPAGSGGAPRRGSGSARAVIDAYNARTDVHYLVPTERNGYALATWRGERTASVKLSEDGRHWVDFGAGGQRADGRHDGGDAFELRVRLEGKSKAEVVALVAREMG